MKPLNGIFARGRFRGRFEPKTPGRSRVRTSRKSVAVCTASLPIADRALVSLGAAGYRFYVGDAIEFALNVRQYILFQVRVQTIREVSADEAVLKIRRAWQIFRAEASDNSIDIDNKVFKTIEFRFLELSKDHAATCEQIAPKSEGGVTKMFSISVNPEQWAVLTEIGKEQVLLHQLSHCVLGQMEHRDGILDIDDREVPSSLLHTTLLRDGTYLRYKKMLLGDVFDF